MSDLAKKELLEGQEVVFVKEVSRARIDCHYAVTVNELKGGKLVLGVLTPQGKYIQPDWTLDRPISTVAWLARASHCYSHKLLRDALKRLLKKKPIREKLGFFIESLILGLNV